MTRPMSPADAAKRAAALRAADEVQSGMRIGLGTGSTAAWLVRVLGDRVRGDGLKITAVATSTATATLAGEVGIEVTTLDDAGWLDLTIDGADEFDGTMALIKGGGGALLQEKIVATASDRMIVIADPAKRVRTLGAFPLPVEVLGFGLQSTRTHIDRLLADMDVGGTDMHLRSANGAPFVTDEGNHILDLDLRRIGDPATLEARLNRIPGVVENGLFVDICDQVVIGHADGRAEIFGARDVPEPAKGDIAGRAKDPVR